MRTARMVSGFASGMLGIGLFIAGLIHSHGGLIASGIVLFALGAIALATVFIAVESSSKREANPLRADYAPSAAPAFEAPPRGERFPARVRRIRNSNSMRGTVHFGTEIVVEVERDGTVVQGFVQQYLTPVQIACLAPGSAVQVVPAPGGADRYLLLLEQWQEG